MKKVVEIPNGAEVSVEGRKVIVKGSKGTVEKDFSNPVYDRFVKFGVEDGKFYVEPSVERRDVKALVGTIESHVKNMIKGVTEGYTCIMKIHYLHFPINVTVKGDEVHIKNFLGEKGDRIAKIVNGVKVSVGKDEITITGINKEDVGQTAANIEQICYVKNKDRRVFQDGIFIYKKP